MNEIFISLKFSRLAETRGQPSHPKIYFFTMGMRTLKQIEASRVNGAKSRGPIKDHAACLAEKLAEKNALRYELLSGSLVLPGESRTRFLELMNSFVAQLKPANDLEFVLVGNMAMAHWRQLRAASLLKSEIENGMAKLEGPNPNRAAEVLKDPGNTLKNLQKDEITYERQFCRNLRALLQVKEGRLIPDQSVSLDLTPTGGTWDPEPAEDPSVTLSEPRA